MYDKIRKLEYLHNDHMFCFSIEINNNRLCISIRTDVGNLCPIIGPLNSVVENKKVKLLLGKLSVM